MGTRRLTGPHNIPPELSILRLAWNAQHRLPPSVPQFDAFLCRRLGRLVTSGTFFLSGSLSDQFPTLGSENLMCSWHVPRVDVHVGVLGKDLAVNLKVYSHEDPRG